MHTSLAHQLVSGSPVWIWMVRLAKGKWWPGVVEQVATVGDMPTFRVRFESFSSKKSSRPDTFVGISTTRARYLELLTPKLRELISPASFPYRYFNSRRSPNGPPLWEGRMATPEARTPERVTPDTFLFSAAAAILVLHARSSSG
jgi:hypothetical protein